MSGPGKQESHPSDDDLLRILAGVELGAEDQREAAATALFERWHGRVWTWCRRVLADDDQAADVAQEVFTELLHNASRYASSGRFGAWLYVVTRNRCLNERKRSARLAGADLRERFAAVQGRDRVADDPAVGAARGEIAEYVRRACHEQLTPREQEVIWLRYRWGLKVDEIRTVLGLENASGARTHLRTAERKLRRALAGLQEHPDGESTRKGDGSWTN